jgi:hypothetical protein
VCGHKYETGRREWAYLSAEEKRKYLWSGLVVIPVVTTALAAIGGYFLRWHEPFWMMSVILGFLGLLSGLICSALLLTIRGLPGSGVVAADQTRGADSRRRSYVAQLGRQRKKQGLLATLVTI